MLTFHEPWSRENEAMSAIDHRAEGTQGVPLLAHIAFFAAYAMAAGAIAVGLPDFVPGLDEMRATILAGAGFLLLAFLHEFIARRVAHGGLRDDMADMRAQLADAEAKLNTAHSEIGRLRTAVGVNRELVAEIRVLQGLVDRLEKPTAGPVARPMPTAASSAYGATVPPRRAELVADAPLVERPGARRTPVPPSRNRRGAELLETTKKALSANRIDLYIQPVVTLPDRKVRFYESFSRLRDEQGTILLPEDYIPVAVEAGLVSTVDNLLLFRCVQLLRRAMRERSDVGFFCNLSAHSLTDRDFFDQFLEYMEMNKELAKSLIFELPQADLAVPGVLDALAPLHRLGFSFSIDRAGLDIDFRTLAKSGVKYVKVEADRIAGHGGHKTGLDIPVIDLQEAMKRAGVSLIVDRVETEGMATLATRFDLPFGQGYLFGEPRLARDSR